MKTHLLILGLLLSSQVIFGQNPILWNKDLAHVSYSISGDRIYVLMDKKISAFNATTSELVWETPTDIYFSDKHQIHSDAKHIYAIGKSAPSYINYIICYDANTGAELWRIEYPEKKSSPWFTGLTDDLFIYQGDKKVYALNPNTGEKVFTIPKDDGWANLFGDHLYINNHIYVNGINDKDRVSIYDYKGKEITDNFMIGDTTFKKVEYADENIMIAQSNYTSKEMVYVIDRKSNHILWGKKLLGGTYLGSFGNLIVEIDYPRGAVFGRIKKTGEEIWKYEILRPLYPFLPVDENSIIVCSRLGTIVKLNAQTGQELWKEKLELELGISDFTISGSKLCVSIGARSNNDWINDRTKITMFDLSKMTSGSLEADLKNMQKKEELARKVEEIRKRMEYQRANTFLTINSGGHISTIRKMVVTNDGKFIITAGDDKVIYIRNAQTGEVIDALYGKIGDDSEGQIYAMALSPDNKYLAVAGFFSAANDFSGRKGAIRLYDFPNRKLLGLMQEEESGVVNTLAFSEDSKYLVSGIESMIKVWNVEKRSFERVFKEEHGFPVYSLAVLNGKVVSGAIDRKVKLWDLSGFQSVKSDSTHTKGVTCVAFSPDGLSIASGGYDNALVIYDKDLNVKQIIENESSPSNIAFSPDGKSILLGTEGDSLASNLYGFDGVKWTKIAEYSGLNYIATLATAFLDNNTAVCAGGENYEIAVWTWQPDPKTKQTAVKELRRFCGNGRPFYGIGFKNNQVFFTNNFAIDFTQASVTHSFDLVSKKLTFLPTPPTDLLRAQTKWSDYSLEWVSFPTKDNITGIEINRSGLKILKSGSETKRIEKEGFEGYFHSSYSFVINTKQNLVYLVSGGNNGIMLAYRFDGVIVSRLVGHRDVITDMAITPDWNYLLTCSADQTIKIWNMREIGEKNTDLPAPADVADPMFQEYYKQRKLFHVSREKSANAWTTIINDMRAIGVKDYADYFQKLFDFYSAGKVKPVASLFIGTDGEWILWSEDGYFTSSKYGGKYIGYHINLGYDKEAKFYPFEQFDLKFNRPDIMLKRVGIDDKTLEAAYYLAYKKRLSKMGLTDADLSEDLHLPEIVLKSRSQETTTNTVDVEFDAMDDTYLLDHINIFVNDVPVYGSKGLSVKNLKLQQINQKLSVELTKGKNKIQVSAMNEKGVESMKETYYVTCNLTSLQVKNRYVVVIGVSDYDNDEYDLKYASKDAGDLASLLELNKGEFANTKILRILNKEATRENILKAKQFLLQSKVNDQVIVFVAGHGLLDENLDWYFGTTDIDFDNPSENGLAYSELEGLLDSIPARNKLMLMDACHSGEVDKDESLLVADTSQIIAEVKSRGFKKVVSTEQPLGLQNSFKLMQEIFTSLSKGTGTTVISSASGAEFAYESATWNNGVFTFALLEGLKTGNADINKDKKITVSELRNYIVEKVNALTLGKQNPTSRTENLEFDFKVW